MIEVTDEVRDLVVNWRSKSPSPYFALEHTIQAIIELHEANKPKPEPLSEDEMPVGRLMVNGVLLSPDCTTAFILGVRFAEQKHGIG